VDDGERVFLPHETCIYCDEELPGDCTPECHHLECKTLVDFILDSQAQAFVRRLKERHPPAI
jgi:hypothetical protein